MNRIFSLLFSISCVGLPVCADADPGTAFSFTMPGGLEIFGDHHAGRPDSRGAIALFHQGGANARAEYGNIIPGLLDRGFEVYAFDMRAGGEALGGENRTIAGMGGDDGVDYCDVYPDFESVLDFLHGREDRPVILWGSSYSGALVFQLASKRPEQVSAVLGFSPASGGPMVRCRPGLYLDGIGMPAIAFRPEREMGQPSTDQQKEAFEAAGIPFHVIPESVHGSSMLNPQRNPGDVSMAWALVTEFLSGL